MDYGQHLATTLVCFVKGKGASVRGGGASVLGSFCPGGFCQGGLSSGGLMSGGYKCPTPANQAPSQGCPMLRPSSASEKVHIATKQ